jgi:uncharacterized BrkB/YihY/UPF0761 family membrane protein
MVEITEITQWLSELDHLSVREWVNGLWFAVSFAMCFEFGKSLIYRIRKHKWSWRDDIGTRAILALFGYFAGETLMRGWIWMLLALQNNGSPMTAHIQQDYYIAFIAAGMSTWAAMCCLYVFGRNHWVWIRAAVIIIVFVIVEMVLL